MSFRAAMATLAVVAAPVMAPTAVAQDLASKLINTPKTVKSWGSGVTVRQDSSVQGGRAFRVQTTGAEPNVWDVGLYSAIEKPVKSGDRLILAFWARVEKAPDGADTATLSHNAIQYSSPPHAPVVKGAVTVTSKWQLYQITGTADRDYKAGELTIGLQLAGEPHTVDIGPVFAFNMGQ